MENARQTLKRTVLDWTMPTLSKSHGIVSDKGQSDKRRSCSGALGEVATWHLFP